MITISNGIIVLFRVLDSSLSLTYLERTISCLERKNMKQFFEYLNILVIPTDTCNLNCEYCFHNDYILQDTSPYMTRDILEHLIKISIPYYKNINYIWHGGEPLSMGISFYEDVVNLQKKYNKFNTIIRNNIQTNMTLMDKYTAKFLIENGFNVSTSYDGIKNEELRHNTSDFFNGKFIWEQAGGKCGMIMVVSNMNIDTLIESYEYFKQEHINYVMNPYTKSLFEDHQKQLIISGNKYAEKMIEFFDYWKKDENCNIIVKYFHEIINYILYKKKSKCNVTSCLGKWLCVRPNGTVTPCNRYFPTEYSFGNILDMYNINQAFESDGFKLLLTQAIERRNKCKSCDIFDYCSGGCNNIALVYGGVDKNNNDMCIALRKLYKHINTYLYKIIADEEVIYNPILRKIVDNYQNQSKDPSNSIEIKPPEI